MAGICPPGGGIIGPKASPKILDSNSGLFPLPNQPGLARNCDFIGDFRFGDFLKKKLTFMENCVFFICFAPINR